MSDCENAVTENLGLSESDAESACEQGAQLIGIAGSKTSNMIRVRKHKKPFQDRGIFDDIGSAVGSGINSVTDLVGSGVSAIGDAGQSIFKGASDALGGLFNRRYA